MKTMKFEKVRFRKGRNVTIRNGTSWHENVAAGDVVKLETVKGKSLGTATIDEITTFPVDEVPPFILRFEHDSACLKKYNDHRHNNHEYSVIFRRWVDAETEV